ncbi:anaphase-promoting complex subunit 11 [Nematocida sp. LUAm3]|nr:anaphase-promoting complex subunit 11 [Nematocida sp. LUAm3]KAI5176351.1 anaphase-promoting complex subunit 11 [Nematocida sp. LUAm2]KAI5179365.1 anaphase-promoting complex subunit 11 [Nematocida sp. LUAm1]
MKIRINSIQAAYSWKWKGLEGICGICQQSFEQMCSECSHPLECHPALGICKHFYHKHCIMKWISSSNLCPLCRSEWRE